MFNSLFTVASEGSYYVETKIVTYQAIQQFPNDNSRSVFESSVTKTD